MSGVALNISELEIGYQAGKKDQTTVAGPIDMHVSRGELICLLGPNGVGKSTLLRTLAGIQKALTGTIYIQSENIAEIGRKQLAQLLSVVLTDRVVSANLTALDLIQLGRTPYTGWFGNLREEDQQKVSEAIDLTHIHHLIDKNINELSDGEKQKVMITRALSQDTPIVLLDEPTAHLDLPNRIEIVRLLRRLARETKKAIIMSTHELDLALQAADRIWLMSTKNKSYSGIPEDLVLSDVFGNEFTREGVEFDKHTGVFKVVEPHCDDIVVQGEEPALFWTKRALERSGYTVLAKGATRQKIRVSSNNGEWMWKCESGKRSEQFTSIEELTSWLLGKEDRRA